MAYISGSTSRHCYVVGCSSGDYHLRKWQQRHMSLDGTSCMAPCTCTPPYQLNNFPTKAKNPAKRNKWLVAINRADKHHSHKLKEPSTCHRVCSKHFVGGNPSDQHPDPELHLAHEKKLSKRDEAREERAIKRGRHDDNRDNEDLSNFELPEMIVDSPNLPGAEVIRNALKFIIFILLGLIRKLKSEITLLRGQNIQVKAELSRIKIKKQKATLCDAFLINDKKVSFYTGLPSIAVFDAIHSLTFKFVRRRWRGAKCVSRIARKFHNSPKKFGPQRKLHSRDELLLTLMKLRLGLLNEHLADMFKVSSSSCMQIFHSWLTALDKVQAELLFWPSKEQVHTTKPARYRAIPGLRAIIDCSEVFIETPKDFNLQSSTWSDYKHHNTGKFLIAVAPNSQITFVSRVYNGRASDKAITLHSGFLDKLDPYDVLQADKGFNIVDECAARHIHLHVPPGKRGAAQMSTPNVTKTKRVANLRILVEQVIRRLKTFRILKSELTISLIPCVDKIVRVCAGLCNLKEPIYST